jgi:hypothetical protein
VTPDSGIGNETITIKWEKNANASTRSGDIAFSTLTNVRLKNLTVNQAKLATRIKEDVNQLPNVAYAPNPTNGYFNITLTSSKQEYIHIQVSALDGKNVQQIFKGLTALGENVINGDITALPNGLYLLSIKNQEGYMKYHKLLLQK